MKQVIGGKVYDTDKARLIGDTEFTDRSNRYPGGRASYLYKTKKGNFFKAVVTCWQGEHDCIEPLTVSEAKEVYEGLDRLGVGMPEYQEVFGEEPEEA